MTIPLGLLYDKARFKQYYRELSAIRINPIGMFSTYAIEEYWQYFTTMRLKELLMRAGTVYA